ncbi:uncharacterized protein LOC123596360 [Leopardus geoffroyi]|uniref:uncharacterized protein LOC123596360 n=1 Tax=Leopardus geoffroyi TaxID=46844 RepID=UPI001E260029|nr:uncharacterized protein LOC123596360 [Leopardus geoffroyi]
MKFLVVVVFGPGNVIFAAGEGSGALRAPRSAKAAARVLGGVRAVAEGAPGWRRRRRFSWAGRRNRGKKISRQPRAIFARGPSAEAEGGGVPAKGRLGAGAVFSPRRAAGAARKGCGSDVGAGWECPPRGLLTYPPRDTSPSDDLGRFQRAGTSIPRIRGVAVSGPRGAPGPRRPRGVSILRKLESGWGGDGQGQELKHPQDLVGSRKGSRLCRSGFGPKEFGVEKGVNQDPTRPSIRGSPRQGAQKRGPARAAWDSPLGLAGVTQGRPLTPPWILYFGSRQSQAPGRQGSPTPQREPHPKDSERTVHSSPAGRFRRRSPRLGMESEKVQIILGEVQPKPALPCPLESSFSSLHLLVTPERDFRLAKAQFKCHLLQEAFPASSRPSPTTATGQVASEVTACLNAPSQEQPRFRGDRKGLRPRRTVGAGE